MKVLFIIGHRGAGKSTFSKLFFQADWVVTDLDVEIEKKAGITIQEIFSLEGEKNFRKLEWDCVQELLTQSIKSQKNTVIVLGAGFEKISKIKELPVLENLESVCFLWIRRDSDRQERFFLDRPSLSGDFENRFKERDQKYQKNATHVLTLQEGESVVAPYEKSLKFYLEVCGYNDSETDRFNSLKGWGLTLLPDQFHFDYSKLRPGFFEIRNDLVDGFQLPEGCQVPADIPRLLSFRKIPDFFPPLENAFWDWDLNLGDPPPGQNPSILSCHPCENEFDERLELLTSSGRRYPRAVLKFAPRINLWRNLQKGEQWRAADPERRAFLPMTPATSKETLWTWYRLFRGGDNPINFFRLGQGSSLDQPTLLEVKSLKAINKENFCALLGEGIEGSWSPVEHQKYLSIPYFRIPVARGDLSIAKQILDQLGMVGASLTSPHKSEALSLTDRATEKAVGCNSVNTWGKNSETGKWLGECTDLQGLELLRDQIRVTKFFAGEIAVWGGGGMLGVIKKIFPQATFFSSRDGRVKEGPALVGPRLLIWAGGRSPQHPPAAWSKPEFLLDLSYSPHSQALEFARNWGLKPSQIIQGHLMFSRQAALQREFWRPYGFVGK
jgi:shikimate kinase